MYKRLGSLAAMALGAVLDVAALVPLKSMGPNPRANSSKSHFDPVINRHTGKPHEHRREIAKNRARFCRKAA